MIVRTWKDLVKPGFPHDQIDGETFRAIRENVLGVSQTRLAKAMGLARQSIVRYEVGERPVPLDTALALCFVAVYPDCFPVLTDKAAA